MAGHSPILIDRLDALVDDNTRLRAALQGLVNALAANDEDGLTEFADVMVTARKALSLQPVT